MGSFWQSITYENLTSLCFAHGRIGRSKGTGSQSYPVVRSFLMNALRLDRMNHSAWYNLGLLYKAMSTTSASQEAAECFAAAAFLEESAPVEPFR
nr:protein npgr2 [Quercus suber]